MRWLIFMTMGASIGCGPAAHLDDTVVEEPEVVQTPPKRVKRWFIATTGDQPPSCDERLAAEGLGPDDDALGIPMEIVHLNEMGSVRLVALSYTVDGSCSFSWHFDSSYTSQPNQLNVLRAQLPAGEHEVALVAEFAPMMPTPYGYDYRVKLRGSYTLDLDSATRLFVTSYDTGEPTTPMEKRPALRFELGSLQGPRVLSR